MTVRVASVGVRRNTGGGGTNPNCSRRVTTLAALDSTFSLTADDDESATRLACAFAALSSDGPARHALTVTRRQGGAAGYAVSLDSHPATAASTFEGLVDTLVSRLNQLAIAESGRWLLLHAAAAESNGRGVVLPAPSGSGKSTLVDHLVGAGFGYLADEIVAVDPATLSIVPYPKPLLLEVGSERVVRTHPGGVQEVQPSVIVRPQFSPGRGGALRPVKRSQAVLLLADNAFNFHDHGVRGLRTLAQLVRQCETYELDVDDLATALGHIRSALADNRGWR